MNFYLLEDYKLQIFAIFAIRVVKVLIIFLNIVILFKEFGIVLSIIVQFLYFMKVISFLGLNWSIKTIKPIVKFSSILWKKLLSSFEIFGLVETMFIRKSDPTSFSLLRKLF